MTYQATNPIIATTDFGSFLRYLRLRLQLNQRDLAIAVGYSESQISRLEQNQRLPDINALRARFLPALQIEEDSDLAAQLIQLAHTARQPDAESDTQVPVQTIAEDWPTSARRTLPTPLTSLINREHELHALTELIRNPAVRIVTLLGPPGIGKTRLALQIASVFHDQFRDGVWFVSLAPVRDAGLVLPTIAHVLGMRYIDQPALSSAIHARELLLVLDNMEQVADAASQIAELLRMVPALKILVTSRSPLRITGEQQYPVPALELPPVPGQLPVAQLAHYPAIRLFVDRMCAVRPNFVITEENASAITEICMRLDGLPLAIELAAARGKLFTPQHLLERLQSPAGATALQFLVHGPCDLPDHQRTLRSAIDWSYDLLNDVQRLVFVCMAVFADGCTLDALRSVCVATSVDEDVLSSLVNQSLVTISEQHGRLRFHLLETMREYGQEKLAMSGQLADIQQHHARYFAELVQQAAPELYGKRQEYWLRVLEQDHSNLRAALSWMITHDLPASVAFAVQLRQFWFAGGYFNEGRAWLARMLEHADFGMVPAAARAAALSTAGYLAYHQGDHGQAYTLSQSSLLLWQALGNNCGIAQAQINLAGIALLQSDYERATVLYHECLTFFQACDDWYGTAQSLRGLAHVAKDQGDFSRAAELHQNSLTCYLRVGDIRGVCSAKINLSIVAYWMGEYTQAHSLVESALPTLDLIGDAMGSAYALELLGMVHYKQGHYAAAERVLVQGLGLFRKLGDQLGIALMLTDLGVVAHVQGDREQAWALHHEALQLAIQIGDKRRAAFCLEGLAAVTGASHPQQAAQFYGAAAVIRQEIGAPLPIAEQAEYQHGLEIARAVCEPDLWAAAWALGAVQGLGLRVVQSAA
jgi:predicted ATPase/transcriptional regulator with XRE-family HTH domain